MKHMKRANVYQCSNYNCTFSPETLEAHSYRWWCFVKTIGGKVVFNSYRYSNSTSKHQSKVRSLLNELGIKVDRFVQVKEGLNMRTLTDLNKAEKATIAMLEAREESKRIARNERAKARRLAKRQRLDAEFKRNVDSITHADVLQFRLSKQVQQA